jgi:hypothetical protein
VTGEDAKRLAREWPATYKTLRVLAAINQAREERGTKPLPLGPLPWNDERNTRSGSV